MTGVITIAPVTQLAGVGPALAAKLEKLGVESIPDLLFHLPARYEDRTRVSRIGSVRAGERVVIEGEIELTEVVYRGRRSMLCRISDGSGALTLRFFYFSKSQQAKLTRGTQLRCFGEVRIGPGGREMVHPEYRVIDAHAPAVAGEHLTPIYPVTEGLAQGRLRSLAAHALNYMHKHGVVDLIPASLLRGLGMPGLTEALETVHSPPADADIDALNACAHPAQRRLALEEILAHHLSLRRLRDAAQSESAAPLVARGDLVGRFTAALPFKLTGAQQRVAQEIVADLANDHPMLRLLQGDVGSGKTVVAAIAAFTAIEAGTQAVIMAPTELLAEQHRRSFAAWCEPLGVPVAWLAGKQTVAERRAALAVSASGEAQLVVGTHALFQESVDFARLGLAIIDEQHRFGVHQRLSLREKGASDGRMPHQLIMTATPIPRTLAMTAYADLDVSILDELPPGRRPIETVVVNENRRGEVVMRVQKACETGQQAYWVCPLVEESEQLQCQAAEDTATLLAEALDGMQVGLVHGRMPGAEKEKIMRRFAAGEIDVLVATTVIEVGVDVANASLMIIENSERMGLAQLHQLRGRVGRGNRQSACVLLYKPPLGRSARARLQAIRETTDGFEIARRDLELRGPGEVLGTRQAGLIQMKIADLARDAELLPAVQKCAEYMRKKAPDAADGLIARWILGAGRYGQV